jgi:integrase
MPPTFTPDPTKRRERVPGDANRSIYARIEAETGKVVYEIGVRNAAGNQTFVTAENRYRLSATQTERDNLLGARGKGKVVVADARLTFGKTGKTWLAEAVPGLAPNTRESYKHTFEAHLEPRWGRKRIDKLTVTDAAALVRDLRADNYAETTIALVLVVAGSIFRYARRHMNSHAENIIAALDANERAKLSETPPRRYFTPAELDQTIAAAREPWRLPFVVASVTGARQSEIAGLWWGDWDLADVDAASVLIEFQVDRKTGKRVKLKTPESRRRVDVPRFVAVQMIERRAASRFSQDNDFCFATESGNPISQRNLSRELRKAQTRAVDESGEWTFPLLHVKDADGKLVKPGRNVIPSWHGFRHASATEAIGDGEQIEDVADRLGHKSTIVTETIYRHEIKSAKRSAEKRAKLEQRYGSRMAATDGREAQIAADDGDAEIVDLQAKRSERK